MAAYEGRAAALGLLLFGMAACSQVATPAPIVFNQPLPDDPGPDMGGAALQEEVFADGQVTADEYDRAMAAAIECMRNEGFNVDGPLRYPDGPLFVEPGVDPRLRLTLLARGVTDDQRWGDVNGRCQAQWSYAIEQVYLRQFAPTQEDIRTWLERAWACLREKGAPVSSPPTEAEAVGSIPYGCRPWEAAN